MRRRATPLGQPTRPEIELPNSDALRPHLLWVEGTKKPTNARFHPTCSEAREDQLVADDAVHHPPIAIAAIRLRWLALGFSLGGFLD